MDFHQILGGDPIELDIPQDLHHPYIRDVQRYFLRALENHYQIIASTHINWSWG
jgi:hypothetical protein